MNSNHQPSSLVKIAFFQALGLTTYCSLIGLFLAHGNQWFGKIPQYFAPLIFLLLFSTSTLICALITLSFPVILFVHRKQPLKALRLVFYTVLWLVLFISTLVLMSLIF